MERVHGVLSGRLSFIRDFVFCIDLIDEWKKANMADDTGTVAEIMRRVVSAKKYGLLTKNPSLATASNVIVISSEVAREVESKLGGKLSNPRYRDKAFENTYAMTIAVVDRDWERVTFYTRGISGSTDMSFKEVKSVAKNKGPDIADIMRGLMIGQAPAF
jgi:hypothetical protein